ncbi:UbiA-like polyprenyltransferase [Ferroplasma acidiphilum]|jgi:4-hydroxybenzoate polyprenyltransferase|uniref:Prenyltransferase n=1 Tax=Ferroplasma acidiphilum TaxID=74969 RepID=A0A1V0N647_9ARCH|nr:UbiA-like polyprenyltransferase [Ferroplasma acidiphilum]ARD85565.1 prenyltransferase [Ferroplasma acidiphilum]MCL4348973.1 putative 4-hydroxybenzoate polyprenyltransferase [Candidatus Thermoplasmatota archaeon]NOL59256.1 UbiA family prenyltransferase [Ferroplasma acidiphilum]WMT52700.1 MAG: UbiA-like polyprenyltransferase [Ferroplasma acidiphilum]
MKFRDIAEFIKLEHTLFDLPFIYAGAIIASGGSYNFVKYIIIFITATSARGAGMSINRIMGLKYDKTNPRKKNWALVTGKMKKIDAYALTLLLIAIFEVSTYFLNRVVLALSPVVILFFIADPLMKRVTSWRHLFMGLTIGLGVLGGFLAISPVAPPLIIYLVVLISTFWIAGFDIIYTIPDIDYDRANNLKTLNVKYGLKNGMIISSLFHIFTIALFIFIAFIVKNIYYDILLVPIVALIIYQHIVVNPSNLKTIRVSFFNANSFIGIIFLAGMIISFYR